MSFKNLEIYNSESFAELAARFILNKLGELNSGKPLSFALSGGSTPVAVYQKIVELFAADEAGKLEAAQLQFLFGDDRYVPHTDKQSNFLMAKTELFKPLEIKSNRIFEVPFLGADKHKFAAVQYEKMIGELLASKIDLQLLGIGTDGHFASVFPDSPLLGDEQLITDPVAAVFQPETMQPRITLNVDPILSSKSIVVLVKGTEKAKVLAEIFNGRDALPASVLHQVEHKVFWVCDEAAAALLIN